MRQDAAEAGRDRVLFQTLDDVVVEEADAADLVRLHRPRQLHQIDSIFFRLFLK